MSHARLKASTNRVRTSISLQANTMWTDTIGLAQDAQAGSNAAVEASLNAPQHRTGRAARRPVLTEAAAADTTAVAEAGREGSPDLSRPLHFLSEGARARLSQALSKGGFDSAVNSYEGLLTLARSQGAVGGQNRGACKNCGQLGHLTKQCRNHLSTHFNQPQPVAQPSVPAAHAPPQAKTSSSVSDLSSSEDDDSGLSSGSSSEEEHHRKRHHHKRKRSDPASTSKASKKQKKSKHHHHKHGKKHKRRRKD